MGGSEIAIDGVWRNWDLGIWQSWTVTVPATGGLFLVSFITLFIRWSGSHLWSIIAFALHQSRSTSEPRDGLYHQQQVLLRNNTNAFLTVWTLIRLSWRWRDKARGAWRRGLLASSLPAINVVGIAAAAFFSSQFLSPTDHILAKSDVCGWLADGEFVFDQIYSEEVKNLQSDSFWVSAVWTLGKGLEYTKACYESHSNEYSSLCSSYMAPQLPSTVDRLSACPFGENVCSTSAVRIDSGIIDSGLQLGINSPPGEKVGLRKVTTCAPVPLGKYESEWTTYRSPENDTGGVLGKASWKYYDLYELSDETIAFSNSSAFSTRAGYTIEPIAYFGGNSTDAAKFSEPRLKPELMASDAADQVFLLLQNLAVYTEPVTDPWFRASSNQDSRGYFSLSTSDVSGAWFPDAVISGLGCAEQYQFCANQRCTAMSGLHAQDPSSLGLNAAQKATYDVMWKSAWAANMFFIVHFLKDRFLLGGRLLHPSLISAPVAPDQWMQEAENLHNISMAILQRRIVEYANPPDLNIRPGIGTRQFIIPPTSDVERDLCHNVKTRNPTYRSFSLASLSAILLGGILIMLINLWLPHIVLHIRRRFSGASEWSLRKSQAWTGAHVFHLHRAVLEGQSIGPWEPTNDDIPVLRDQRLFGHVEEIVEAEEDPMERGIDQSDKKLMSSLRT